jgi:long-subunit fatty acid transport protein
MKDGILHYGRVAIAAVLFCAAAASAQQRIDEALLSNVPGVGGRALGMGGAFTAIADDATAATWNPAGLAKLTRPEASIVADVSKGDYEERDYFYRYEVEGVTQRGNSILETYQETYRSEGADLESESLNFGSVTYPFRVADRLVVAQLSTRRYFDAPTFDESVVLDREGEIYLNGALFDQASAVTAIDQMIETSGGHDFYSLSLGFPVTEAFRIGLSLNHLDSDTTRIRTVSVYETIDGSPSTSTTRTRRLSKFSGWLFDLGFQADLGRFFSIGAVYHSGLDADMSLSGVGRRTVNGADQPRVQGRGDTEVEWPDGWAAGVAFYPAERWTLALDYSETRWSKAKQGGQLVTDTDPLTDETVFVVSEEDGPFGYPTLSLQKDAKAIRFGVERVLQVGHGALPLRAGYFQEKQFNSYYPVPSGRDFDAPEVDGMTLGVGYSWKAGKTLLQVDLALIHSTTKQTIDDSQTLNGFFPTSLALVQGRFSESFRVEPKLTTDRLVMSFIVRF